MIRIKQMQLIADIIRSGRGIVFGVPEKCLAVSRQGVDTNSFKRIIIIKCSADLADLLG